jgi:acetate kinase
MSSPEAAARLAPSATAYPDGCIAVVNAGSSSIKFSIYGSGSAQPLLHRGKIDGIGVAPKLRVADAGGATVVERA